MNNASFLCKVETAPALRYTANDQTAICEFVVLLPGVGKDAPPSDFLVTVWGEQATDAHTHLKPGMVIMIEGQTRWDVVERDGYKEKIATINVRTMSSVKKATGEAERLVTNLAQPPAPQPVPVAPPAPAPVPVPVGVGSPAAGGGGGSPGPTSYDDIPFARLPDF